MSTDLRIYKTKVLEAMRRANATHQPEVFENSGPDHARIVLDVMLETATQSVDLVSGGMHPDVWSSESLSGFLRRNPEGAVRVLLDNAPGCVVPESSTLNKIRPHDRVEVRWLRAPLSRHLCVTDRKHVRLEYDKQTREASITFGDPDGVGARVAEIFDGLWNHAAACEMAPTA